MLIKKMLINVIYIKNHKLPKRLSAKFAPKHANHKSLNNLPKNKKIN